MVFEPDERGLAWTFDMPGTRVYAVNDNDLVLYDPVNDSAWVGCEDALHLREYR